MSKIAIVGLACEYPDASSPEELWNNVLSKKKSFRKIPKTRLPLEEYYSENSDEEDKIYSSNAAVIEGYEFDRLKFKVSGRSYRSTDLTHWLALDVATRALEDAGFLKERTLPKEKTSVIVGNTLTGEFSRSSIMRLRWPYVQKVLSDVAVSEGWENEQISSFLLKAESNYKSAFAEVTEDTLAGGLSNTIPGRICNYYDFKGGGYTVDGACSSSLLSVANGCNRLLDNEIDLALVGGVDLSLDPFELIGFSKTKALAKNDMKIYDKGSNGFWPGEGCGFALLMRYEDAVKQGHKIYATVNGSGISSDGQGGLTRPEIGGQTLALERAYSKAGYSVDKVNYFEGHGTGTPVGDNVELATINNARKRANEHADAAYIGSIKGNIGHTKAAAGLAGFIKATLAIHNRVIPPVSSCDNPHELLGKEDSQLKIAQKALPWSSNETLKAGVSSMGFGGINVHLTLEGIEDSGKNSLNPREAFLASSYQDAELFVFSSHSEESLIEKLNHISFFAEELSYSELTSLAQKLYQEDEEGNMIKCAILASKPKELFEKMKTLISWIQDGVKSKISSIEGIYLGTPKDAKVGLLFPGQGAPVKVNSGGITRRFNLLEEFYKTHPEKYEGSLRHTSNAQPNIVKASLAGLKILDLLNIKGTVGLGHSLGELTTLYWAGCIREKEVIELAKVRGLAMAKSSTVESGMASIQAPSEKLYSYLTKDVVISGYNARNQTVISGGKGAVKETLEKIKQTGVIGTLLPVSHGFHSHYMEGGKEELSSFLNKIEFQTPQTRVVSSVTGDYIHSLEELSSLLVNQLTEPVRFTKAMERLREEDLDYLIEVGPGQILNSIVGEELGIPVVSLETEKESIKGLLNCAAISYVINKDTDLAEIFNRYIKPFQSIDEKSFFTNPCESVERSSSVDVVRKNVNTVNAEVAATVEEIELEELDSIDPLIILKSLLAEKIELPIDSISNSNRLLDDLHLNSITVGQIVAQAANKLSITSPLAMTEYANATVEEVAEVLANQTKQESQVTEHDVTGVDTWIGTFRIEHELKPIRKERNDLVIDQNWEVSIGENHPLYNFYEEEFSKLKGRGIIVGLTPESSVDEVAILLEGAKKAQRLRLPFVIVQHESKTSSAFAKSFYLESKVDTKVITVPLKEESISYIKNEVSHIEGFTECFYNDDGSRTIPVLSPMEVNGTRSEKINKEDVLLFTGGGKGIASECALSLAKETGSKLGIIGRSDPVHDEELSSTLERAKLLNIPISYQQADVTNFDEIKRAIKSIEKDLGTITGFTHAAGINHPKSLSSLEFKDMKSTIDTKVLGAIHVLNCLQLEKIKFFISFSSIIGRSGLQGESHYGLANEWLTNLTEKYNESELLSKSLSIEWSVWSGVGMGQDLGTVETLRKQGITPIPLQHGIDLFRSLVYDLVEQILPDNTIVVSGRMGNVPTLRYTRNSAPFLRFVEKEQVYYPGYELISDVVLHPDKDRYLSDHCLDGNFLFPAVLGLEAMAQVSSVLANSEKSPNFSDVHFNHPIIIDNHGTTIRVSCVKTSDKHYKVSILSETTNFSIAHFEATCRFESDTLTELRIPTIELKNTQANSIDPTNDMYETFLFQKGRFARVHHYLRVTSRESVAKLKTDSETDWFQEYLPQTLVLDDPGLRDSAIHSLQACIPHKTMIPLSVSSIVQMNYEAENVSEKVVYGKEIDQDKDTHTHQYDLYIYNLDGQILEVWKGLVLKEVNDTNVDLPTGPLLSAYIERKFRESQSIGINLVLNAFDKSRKGNKDKMVYQLSGENKHLFHREDGRPVIDNSHLSFSNHQDLVLGILSETNVACDIESVDEKIPLDEWRIMLGERLYNLAEQISSASDETMGTSCTRVWTILECLKKSDETTDSLVNFKRVDNMGIHFTTSGSVISSYDHKGIIMTLLAKENVDE